MPTPPVVGRNLLIITGAGVFLAAQLGVSLVAGSEPYPTVRMPGFGDAPDAQGMFETEKTAVIITYEDGSTVSPHVSDLMNGFRYSSSGASFNYMFKEDNEGTADSEVTAWLADRAAELYPASPPKYLDACWYKVDVNIETAAYENPTECETERITL